jgi:hypothetical protein
LSVLKKVSGREYPGEECAVVRAKFIVGINFSLFVREHREALVVVEQELLKRRRGPIPLGMAIGFVAEVQPIDTVDGAEVEPPTKSLRLHFQDSKMWRYQNTCIVSTFAVR